MHTLIKFLLVGEQDKCQWRGHVWPGASALSLQSPAWGQAFTGTGDSEKSPFFSPSRQQSLALTKLCCQGPSYKAKRLMKMCPAPLAWLGTCP